MVTLQPLYSLSDYIYTLDKEKKISSLNLTYCRGSRFECEISVEKEKNFKLLGRVG